MSYQGRSAAAGRSTGGRSTYPQRTAGSNRLPGRSNIQAVSVAATGRSTGGRSSHPQRAAGSNSFAYRSNSQAVSAASNPAERFLLNTVKQSSQSHLDGTLKRYEQQWGECWEKLHELSKDALGILLGCLARIPFSCDIRPPQIEVCRNAVCLFLDKVRNASPTCNTDVERLEAVETVLHLIERLLQYEWNREKLDIQKALETILSDAETLLVSRNPDHRKAREKVILLFEELEKPWKIKTIELNQVCDLGTEASSKDMQLSWRQPTVGWLSNIYDFQPCALPKMSVPCGPGNGVYDSPREYFETVLPLWIAMTFIDGNNALLPHCIHRDDVKICDHVLWPLSHTGKNQNLFCRSYNCQRPVAFACANKNHDRGLCTDCAMQQIALLRGPPGKFASTHIYDGDIIKMNYEGDLFIENVESRRPPEHAIHWKTTRRLLSPNLVGIVRLDSRGASLRTSDSILWAQIRAHSDSYDEYKLREAKKLALTILDLNRLGQDRHSPDPVLQHGDRIAIIDCQTFVPEYIPVLKALEAQEIDRLPFNDGALLNINQSSRDILNNPSDAMGSVLEKSSIEPRWDLNYRDILSQVRQAIDSSSLEPVVQIRRHDSLRTELIHGLSKLLEGATLDDGQLKSFLGALLHPVHCTQGPPGKK